jgi:Ca2+-binding EF-hand superfamily protein
MSYDEVTDALRHSLKDVLTDAEARAVLEELDIKKDGIIDTEELRTLIRQRTGKDCST